MRIGSPITFEEVEEHTRDWPRSEAYRYVTDLVESSVRRLGGLSEHGAVNQEAQESFISFESEISIGKLR